MEYILESYRPGDSPTYYELEHHANDILRRETIRESPTDHYTYHVNAKGITRADGYASLGSSMRTTCPTTSTIWENGLGFVRICQNV